MSLYQPIQISPSSEFFIALCQRHGHSYIALGVKEGNNAQLLMACGKGNLAKGRSSLCEVIFGVSQAAVMHEVFMFNHWEKVVLYKAYTITYQHYLEFLHYLKLLSLSQKEKWSDHPDTLLKGYFPNPNNQSLLEWGSIVDIPTSPEATSTPDFDTYKRLGLFNTCRHSAIRLTKNASHRSELGRGVSSLFFKALPLLAVFAKGQLKQESCSSFYILPLPPTAFKNLSAEQLKIISQLYKRLDTIILSAQNNPVTMEKFNKIKGLYCVLAKNSTLKLFDVLNVIEIWGKENHALIVKHRESHWISFHTATQTMFSNFHKQFAALGQHPELNK